MKEIITEVYNFINNNDITWDNDFFPEKWSQFHWQLNDKLIDNIPNISINREKDYNLEQKLNDFKEKMGYNQGVNQNIGGYIQLNDNYREIVLSNINLMTFQSFYQWIMIYLYQKMLLDIEEKYYKPFEYINKNWDEIVNQINNSNYNSEEKSKIINLLKFFVNYLYVSLFTNKKELYIESEGSENINYLSNLYIYEIYYKLGENAIYCDTDMIFFSGDEDLPIFFMNKYFKDLDFPYNIKKVDNIIFFGPKKYIFMKDGEVKIKGFPQKHY